MQKKAAEVNARLSSGPTRKKGAGSSDKAAGTPISKPAPDTQQQLDISALNLDTPEGAETPPDEPPPKITIAREKVLEEARKALEGTGDKKGVSLVVIGKPLWL